MLCLAVKADAYGHGIAQIGRAASEVGVDYLAVATADEGIELRESGCKLPILLYSLATPPEIPEIVRYAITPILSDREQVEAYSLAAIAGETMLAVHIKVDTGMGRIGCAPEEAAGLAASVAEAPGLTLGGTSTHFAAADSADDSYTSLQMERFSAAIREIRGAGISPGIVHAANSGGLIAHPDTWFDMVRPGILAYGLYPSDEQERLLPLMPVMELESQLVYLKQVEADSAISYGMSWRAPERTWIGTIPIGYGDGYNRLLSNRGEVAIGGERFPIVGRVCMDQLMVNLGASPRVRRYDRVTLFGSTESAPTAEDLATICGTIPYEITCNISKRVPRIYEGDLSAKN